MSRNAVHHKRSNCRVCGDDRLRQFLSLGDMPLANSFLHSPGEFDGEESYPLDVYFCENCSLVQLLDIIDPEVLFLNYLYVTGTSETIAAHNLDYAHTIVELLTLQPDDLVIEIGSNDGSLLKCFKQHNVRTLGIEPAKNIAELARAQGIQTIGEFFNSVTAQCTRDTHGAARAVLGNNVLAHIDDPQDFLRSCKRLLKADGLVVIEVPYLRDLIERLEYDTIYHEHLSYFSVNALIALCDAVGLSIVRMDHFPVHGGSLRIYAGFAQHYGNHPQAVLEWMGMERESGLVNFSHFEQFAFDVHESRSALRNLLETLNEKGHTIAGYGAPAKGNTLLNYCGIDSHLLPYTVDRNPMKVNLYTPGMHIPILPVSTLFERQPDYALILAWNFADEIMQQQQEYYARGGHFVIPIPEPSVV